MSIEDRDIRAHNAKIHRKNYNPKQQEFLNFVLKKYVNSGVEELEEEKLSQLLLLKYKALTDAKKELGDIPRIRNTFIGFQGYMYGRRVEI